MDGDRETNYSNSGALRHQCIDHKVTLHVGLKNKGSDCKFKMHLSIENFPLLVPLKMYRERFGDYAH